MFQLLLPAAEGVGQGVFVCKSLTWCDRAGKSNKCYSHIPSKTQKTNKTQITSKAQKISRTQKTRNIQIYQYPAAGSSCGFTAACFSSHLFENFDDSFEKKLVCCFSAEVSCEDMGIPPNCPAGARGRVLVCPEWNVDRSGTLRAKEAASAPAAGTGRPIPRPGGESGSLLQDCTPE